MKGAGNVKRREFLTSSLAASCLAGSIPISSIAAEKGQNLKPEYYELRLYHTLVGPKQKLLNDFLRDVAIPAMNRSGMGPIGVFNVLYGPNSPTLYLLIPHQTIESFATASARLAADAEYQRAGASFLNLPLSDPGYIRMEISLMQAFEKMPRLEAPAAAAMKKSRIFELRTYESHSEKAGKKKVEMFNAGGEIPIFRRTGLQPVFFGETLAGPKMPNLTYMLVFENMPERDKSWERFRDDPEWKKLSANPIYADTVSNITDIFLRPAPYSQI